MLFNVHRRYRKRLRKLELTSTSSVAKKDLPLYDNVLKKEAPIELKSCKLMYFLCNLLYVIIVC